MHAGRVCSDNVVWLPFSVCHLDHHHSACVYLAFAPSTSQAKLTEEEVEARAARRMKAQLLPASTDMPAVPPRPDPKPLTVPQPFALRSEVRCCGSRTGMHCDSTWPQTLIVQL
jgi:hypothetical protein